MNWILDPTADVKSWQVEDYRVIPLDALFEKLEDRGIRLDKNSFVAFADTLDTPEELADALFSEIPDDMCLYDRVYLVVFELWRRLLPEKSCLSIFCDDLDYQMYHYDRNPEENLEALEDALANLQVVLDENTDDGADPLDAFECINNSCANDIESFLHDFILEQIDCGNDSYASELIEAFGIYVQDVNWFEFLRARVISSTDPDEANQIVEQLIHSKDLESDLELYFEILSFLVSYGNKPTFDLLLKKSLEISQTEEDFQTLLSITADFYQRLDREDIETAVKSILNNRSKINSSQPMSQKDKDILGLLQVISKK
ncbi:MAG: hypothetical protein WCJ72_17800 [Chryseobacterium sp.]